jgi:excisionase family DNA binding protein
VQKVELEPLWVTYDEARRLFGLSRTTLWRLLRQDRIRGARVGRSVRLEAQSIQDYLEKQAENFD